VENEQSQRHRPPTVCPTPDKTVRVVTVGSADLLQGSREILSLEVQCRRSAPAVVRAALGEIRGLGPARDDLILVASELVSNAVVHSGGSPADTIQVRAILTREGVSISVRDPGLSADSPQLRTEEALAAGGQGLRIVEQLAHRWGFERDRGHRVWAEVHVPSGATDLGLG
jgi:anti-sigma regulatory factor (Ser/Thr protein kinase)